MIGNDVVDLTDPETAPGSAHARFDARVFSPPERLAIAESPVPARERWVRWASKEAVYKCLRARERTVCFSPVELVVRRGGPTGTEVRWRNRVVPVRLDLSDDCVHAVAWDAAGATGARVVSAVRRVGHADPGGASVRVADAGPARATRRVAVGGSERATRRVAGAGPRRETGRVEDDDPSAAVRRLAVCELAHALGEPEADLRIAKGRDRVPFLRVRDRRVDASLSLSHHGRFVGFACELGPGARWSA